MSDQTRDTSARTSETSQIPAHMLAVITSVEALRAQFHAAVQVMDVQCDAILASVRASAQTGALVMGAMRSSARERQSTDGMPATFGARPSATSPAGGTDGDRQDEQQRNDPLDRL